MTGDSATAEQWVGRGKAGAADKHPRIHRTGPKYQECRSEETLLWEDPKSNYWVGQKVQVFP